MDKLHPRDAVRFHEGGYLKSGKEFQSSQHDFPQHHVTNAPGEITSAEGFRVMAPRTREDRQTATDPDAMQKERLKNRKGGHYKYTSLSNPILGDQDSLSYIDEIDRFCKDAAEHEYEQRQVMIQQQQEQYDKDRKIKYDREESRWSNIEEKFQYEQYRVADLPNQPMAQRNQSSMSYNPILLKYHDNHAGETLKYEDDKVKYRSIQRMKNLHQKRHSQPFNPITGEPYPEDPLPEMPELPVKPVTPEKAEWLGSQRLRHDVAFGVSNQEYKRLDELNEGLQSDIPGL
mmetsp:Transcript_42478/g.51534  ORF Transcript_42478/g.51534 Transcript_42478/m.51534 type:complete len:288 (-) Transcript_42478:342-1205(-)|eukprot:CAMPEP_0197864124 /NCGR_PEP_ID=MMETSP1438-20131217/42106_1 /TAXON_ID=1461541 /ORGANISM="Pterosperma sp., Strain CCMP1384" /LENGTH=287 /DNA_ID=CAMNT_0043482249 /DNA_START=178 /DNA_END=1041 /DNA_ORIENTATION=-